MKQDTSPPPPPKSAKVESKLSSVSVSTTTPSRGLRASATSKAKDFSKPATANGVLSVSPSAIARAKSVPRDIPNNNSGSQKSKRSLVLNKPKSGDDVAVVGSQKLKELEEVKAVARPTRPWLTDPNVSKNKNEGDLDGKKKRELQEKLEQSEVLIKVLQAEVLGFKKALDSAQNLNVELQSQNKKFSEDLAVAEAKIAALVTRDQKRESVADYQSPTFKDIQKLIANKLESPKHKMEAINETSTPTKAPSAGLLLSNTADFLKKVPECSSAVPPLPPPPPPRPRPVARAATTGKASTVLQLRRSLAKRNESKDPAGQANYNKPSITSVHNSIVGEIQNRSAHLLAIKSDIETKGEFIEGLIQKVLHASYTDIEDVLKFVDWLDNELSSLADERAVLKHFKWPEKKADAMREAAIEYRKLKLLESEVSSYKDDADIPRRVSLKRMVGLLDKSERSIQRLIKLRTSVMISYQHHKIPTDWMLDLGIVNKIKQASVILAKIYVKRVMVELESMGYSERESTQEALLLQGVHFAYRAHQFSGGLDSETLCAFKEIGQRVPEHLRGSRELLAGIPSS